MYEKIVVPLDGSKLAEVALPYAEEIAGKMDSDIILLTVLPSGEADEYQNHHIYTKKIAEFTKRQVEKYFNKPRNKVINVETATRVGSPAEGILDYVSKGDFNLIVMATHGRSGISRWAVGSIADKVVRATTRQPLMLIRAKETHSDIRAKRILKKILVPLDGSVGSEAVIPYIRGIARGLQAEITLLRVATKNNHTSADAEAYLQGWCRQLEDKGISTKYEVRVGSAADQIIDLADKMAIDVVAMSTRGQTGISLWTLGSVAQKVLLGGNTALLLIRA